MKAIFEKDTGDVIIKVQLSDDRLKLYLDCERNPKGKKLTLDAFFLKNYLKDCVDPDRLKDQVLDAAAKAVNAGNAVKERLIAHGKPPVKGEDGRIQFLVRRSKSGEKTNDTTFIRDIQNMIA
jgi:uncharacterized protein (DUF342 family)